MPEVLLRLLLVSSVMWLVKVGKYSASWCTPPQFATLPLAVASKLTQAIELYRIKAQGDVSALMWGLAAYGCAGMY